MRSPERPAERVYADLKRRLDSGEWASGDQLPTVLELSAHYSASRGTIAAVIKRLSNEGYLRTVRAWGTFKT